MSLAFSAHSIQAYWTILVRSQCSARLGRALFALLTTLLLSFSCTVFIFLSHTDRSSWLSLVTNASMGYSLTALMKVCVEVRFCHAVQRCMCVCVEGGSFRGFFTLLFICTASKVTASFQMCLRSCQTRYPILMHVPTVIRGNALSV